MTWVSQARLPGKLLTQAGMALPVAIPAGGFGPLHDLSSSPLLWSLPLSLPSNYQLIPCLIFSPFIDPWPWFSAHGALPIRTPRVFPAMEPWPHPAHPRQLPRPQDPHLDKFFTLVHVLEEGAFPFRLKDTVLSEGTVEQELRASLAALRLASPEPLVAFSHHVLDKLVRLVVRPPIIGGQIGERAQPETCFPI